MKYTRYILTLLFCAVTLCSNADTVIRYVRFDGAYKNGGTTWDDAKNNIQDAINAVKDAMHPGDEGRVYVAAGTYVPSESTEMAGGSTQYNAFKLYAGISLYGGFDPENPEATPEERQVISGGTIGVTYMKHRTVLSGNLTKREAVFKWSDSKHQYATSYYGNTYHVVYFATNGQGVELDSESAVDGFVIRDGNARNTVVSGTPHNAYGGGVYMVKNSVLRNCEVYHCSASRNGGGVYMDQGGRIENCYIHSNQTLGLGVQFGQGGGVAMHEYGRIERSFIINNVSRQGGGVSLTGSESTQGATRRSVLATLIANNNALIEGGGVYIHEGGLLNNVSVVNNACYGTGVTINGLKTGRSGGVYIRKRGTLYNSILWGNVCGTNSDAQYAFSTPSGTYKADVKYIAVQNADGCNWTGTTRATVYNLSPANQRPEHYSGTQLFALFNNPSTQAGVLTSGFDASDAMAYGESVDWEPESYSDLNEAGVLQRTPNFSATDVLGRAFSPKCVIGAYKARQIEASSDKMEAPYIASDFSGLPGVDGTFPTFYVDPNIEKPGDGSDWDNAYHDLVPVMERIRRENLGDAQVFVKAGVLTTANTESTEADIRETTIHMYNGTRVYGGFAPSLTGEDKSLRNPLQYITVISGNIDDSGYANNSHHLITYGTDAHNTVLDGFQFRYANAVGAVEDEFGAALHIHNGDTRMHFVRNCVFAGNTATHGGAVYISTAAHFTFTNCIFHNNETLCKEEGNLHCGVVHIEPESEAIFDHCDFIRNVGYAISVQGRATVTNSVFYANVKTAMDDTRGTTADQRLDGILINGGTVTAASNNIYDQWDSQHQGGQAILTYLKDGSPTYPLFVNPTRNAGVSPAGDITTYGRAADWMPMNMNPVVNAANAAGDHTSWGTDIAGYSRDFGGLPDIGAVENRENPEYPDGQLAYGTVMYVRDYNTYNADGTIATEDLSDAGRDGSSWDRAINGNAVYSGSYDKVEASTIVAEGVDYILKSKTNKVINSTFNQSTTESQAAHIQFEREGGYLQMSSLYYPTYYIKIGDQYVAANPSNNDNRTSLVASKEEAMPFILTATENDATHGALIRPVTNTGLWLNCRSSGATPTLGFYNSVDDGSTFTIKTVSDGTYPPVETPLVEHTADYSYVTGASSGNTQITVTCNTTPLPQPVINGLQKAIDTQSERYLADHPAENTQVWVGAGLYPGNYKMREGVNVLGGFPAVGNPRENERDLSNSYVAGTDPKAGYTAILDGKGAGAVVWQNAAYADASAVLWEGFIFQNGYLNGGTTGGAGAHLAGNSTLKNVLVQYNRYDNPTDANNGSGGAGIYITGGSTVKESKIQHNTMYDSAYRAGGCGVYVDSEGENKFINSLIFNNHNYASGTHNLGAALYVRGTNQTNFYNCTIAYNYSHSKNHNGPATAAVWDAGKNAHFYNCIIWGNYADGNTWENGWTVGIPGYDSVGAGGASKYLYNCYQSTFCNSTSSYNGLSGDLSELVAYSNNGLTVSSKNPGMTALSTAGLEYMIFCHKNSPFEETFDEEAFIRDVTVAALNVNYNDDFSNAAISHTNYSQYYTTNCELRSSLEPNSNSLHCINKGIEEVDGYFFIEENNMRVDIQGDARIQDCTIDKGAYEYNGALLAVPSLFDADGNLTDNSPVTAEFYVTQNGRGLSSGTNPANAACMQKLQIVLDAAGRYKYRNPGVQVVVKLAAIPENTVKYYPCRTTDPNSANPRVWSIMVPRGVELWGGYTDEYENDDVNGFTGDRDVLGNKTYLGAAYTFENTKMNAYHVVQFTDYVFDADGHAYLNTEADKVATTSGSSNNGAGGTPVETGAANLLRLSSVIPDARGIVDGCFITGGQADGEAFANGTTAYHNVNRYGAGALINDFGHVRNCIVENNTGVNGAAVALLPGGLVSGTLMQGNNADENGGGVYVFPHGTQLSDGNGISTVTNTAETIASVYTSTIVGNNAGKAGGGVWINADATIEDFPINSHFNSVVVWNNNAPEGANVYGYTSPNYNAATDNTYDVFPFAYSAVQGERMSGLNNFNLDADETKGVRFSATDAYRAPSFLSTLCNAGMPSAEYKALVTSLGLSAEDFAENTRTGDRHLLENIEVGARVFPGANFDINASNIITRLYVSEPVDVDVEAATALYNSHDQIYSQAGASFGYPFQTLDRALIYIYAARMQEQFRNTQFEVFVGRGTYYPTRELTLSGSRNALANTFLIPEGVSINGGYNPRRNTTTKHFYGQIGNSQPSFTTIQTEDAQGSHTINIDHLTTLDMNKARVHEDVNANTIIEPWEFQNQTILSGDVMNTEDHYCYHVMTVVPDATLAGLLPDATVNGTYATNGNKTPHRETSNYPITIDGVQVMDGMATVANEELFGKTTLAGYQAYNYYHGGGLLVDGNWYRTSLDETNPTYKHTGIGTAVGYRNIPVGIHNCIFNNNHANYGGAISTNGEINITGSSLSHNMALATTEEVSAGRNANYPGNGGAIYFTSVLNAVNTLFANNEATKGGSYDATPQRNYVSYRVVAAGGADTGVGIYGGAGGVLMGGFNSFYHLVNCDLVRNKAAMYPAIYTLNPNDTDPDMPLSAYNQSLNTLFWGNSAVAATAGGDLGACANFNVNLDCSQTTPEPGRVMTEEYQTAWFSAYEKGTGHPASNIYDCRRMPFDYNTNIGTQLGSYHLSEYHKFVQGANANIEITAENTGAQGPNFQNPSSEPGFEGYNDASDWSFARINVLTDQGSGFIKQNTSVDGTTVTFGDITDREVANGAYVIYRDHKGSQYLPLGDEMYMLDDSGVEDPNLLRVARDYSPGSQYAYVDIGVYEFPHIVLDPDEGDEIDILWVSTKENRENGVADGHTWQTPTSDIQLAIETLLASRNGHRKEVRVIEGEYSPIYNRGGDGRYFYINLKELNPVLPLRWKHTLDQTEFYPQSLTIKGGYSRELEGIYNPELYPSVFTQAALDNNAALQHILVVEDARQCYGDGDQPTSTLMPIQVDGLTFINDQAASTTEGCALLYKDTEGEATNVVNVADANGPSTLYPGKLTISKCIFRENTGLSAVKIGTGGGNSLIYNTLFADNKHKPLVTINTKFINNTVANNVDPVEISGFGGTTTDLDQIGQGGNGVGGGGQLAPTNGLSALFDTKSVLYNNIFWMNNAGGTQVIASHANGSTYNLPTAGKIEETLLTEGLVERNAFTGLTPAVGNTDDSGNRRINNTNDNSEGPHFADPANGDYHLTKESKEVINRGKNPLYDYQVYDHSYYEEELTVNGERNYTLIDLAGNTRKISVIDLGAYEFQGNFQRVVYVRPGIAEEGDGETWAGAISNLQDAIEIAAQFAENHEAEAFVFVEGDETRPFGRIIMKPGVSLYGGIKDLSEEAPRLLDADRGTDIEDDDYDLTLIRQYEAKVRMTRPAVLNPDNEYRTIIRGIDLEGAWRNSDGKKFYITTTLDGLDITQDGMTDGEVAKLISITKTPLVNLAVPEKIGTLNNHPVVLRNSYIHGNLSPVEDQPLVKVDDALLYNVLIANNVEKDTAPEDTHDAILDLGLNGYTLGVTVAEPAVAADKVLTGATEEDNTPASRFKASVLYTKENVDAQTSPFVPFNGQPLGDATGDDTFATPNYRYQLADAAMLTTDLINQVSGSDLTAMLPAKYLGSAATDCHHPVNLRVDYDLLGNRRAICGAMDFGALEQYIVDDANRDATLTGGFRTLTSNIVYNDKTYTPNAAFAVNDYPQPGSVVCVQEGKTLNFDYEKLSTIKMTNHLDAATDVDYAFNPAFLLMQKDANLYANGLAVNAVQVGLEKDINADGTIVALPYAVDYTQAFAAMPVDNLPAVLNGSSLAVTVEAYDYSGQDRSDWQYNFATANSPAWTAVEAKTPACFGVLCQPADENAATYRFTGCGTSVDQPIYTEARDGVSKTVTFDQYDDKDANGAAEFTDRHNMGWNLVGLPYLVTDYKTYANKTTDGYAATMAAVNEGVYAMHIPHTLWIHYDELEQSAAGEYGAGYYSVKSWSNNSSDWHLAGTPAIWWGEGIFLQTSVNAASETLTFHRPDFVEGVSPVRQYRSYVGNSSDNDIAEDLAPQAPAFKTRKVTVKAGRLAVTVPEGAAAVEVLDTNGRTLYTTDADTEVTLPNGVYVLRVK